MSSARGENQDLRMELIAMSYRLHGALRSVFAGPAASTGLALLEALALGAVVSDRHPPTASEIGRELGFSRQSVQRAVNKLVELDLVRTEHNPRHKAAPVFVPTKAGLAHMVLVEAPSRQLAAKLVDAFDDERSQRLLDELAALLAAINAKALPTV